MLKSKYDLIAIVGPTASGKTQLAAHLASMLNGEVISADSRQVYRGMTIGTGKDLDDYVVDGNAIPYHLIDIVNAGYKFNVFEYQQHFIDAYTDIKKRNRMPILCGGSGLYIDAVLRGYKLLPVPENPELRRELEAKTDDELAAILASYKLLHNTTDLDTRKRTIRAIEIEEYYCRQPVDPKPFPAIRSIIFGVKYQRAAEMIRIRERLVVRLKSGLIEEVQSLLNSGISADDLIYYGLEYKYITEYLLGKYSYDEMVERLNIAIRQFAKRQMTWFRGMERKGFPINWIPGELSLEEKLALVISKVNE